MKQFSLHRKERITNKKQFDEIYASGKTVYSSDRRLKAVYHISEEVENPGVKMAVAVSRKAGKAFWRNRIKRLIKEAFRLNKEILKSPCIENQTLILVVFAANSLNQKKNRKINLNLITTPVVDLLNKLRKKI